MVYKKYALLFAICFATVAQGASSGVMMYTSSEDSSGESEPLLPSRSVGTGDMSAMKSRLFFDIDTVMLPADNKVHVPFFGGTMCERDFFDVLCSDYRFCGYAGFFSGSRRQAVVAMAQAAAELVSSHAAFDKLSVSAKKSVAVQNPELLTAVEDCCMNALRFIKVLGKYRKSRPQIVMPGAYCALRRQVEESRRFKNIDELVMSIKAAAVDVCRCAQEKDSHVQFVQVPMLVQRKDLAAFDQEVLQSYSD